MAQARGDLHARNDIKYADPCGVPGLYDYLVSVSCRPTPELTELHQVTRAHARAGMVSPPDSVPVLQLLLKALRAQKVLEVGVFTGYMTLALALALPEEGKVVACDISAEYPAIGRPFWERAGVAAKINLRVAPATETLAALLEGGEAGTFDLAFIDADKPGYDAYYEAALRLLRPGGLVAIDNVLWDGAVLQGPDEASEATKTIQALNRKVHGDERVDICMLTNADGITLALKR